MNRTALRNLVRTWLNEPTAGLWSDAELNTFLDIGVNRVNSLISSLDEDYFTVSETFSTTIGAKSYALPTSARNILRLEHYSTSDPYDIVKIDPLPFPRMEGGGEWPFTANGKPLRYVIRGTQFDLYPIPDAVYTLRIYIDKRQDAMVDDNSTPTTPLEYHDMIAIYTVILALPKNHESASEFMALWNNREVDLITTISNRKQVEPQKVEGYLEGIY